jgi:hypothetical protein
MRDLVGRPVFSRGFATYRWGDVVLAGCLWGRWQAVERRAVLGAVCARLAEEGEELDEDEVDSAADEFRYRLGLLSADETEAWLGERGLSVEEWMSYISRTVLLERWSARAEQVLDRDGPPDVDMDRLVLVEAICSGSLAELANELAGRIATAGETPIIPPVAIEARYGMDPAECAERASMLVGIDAAYEDWVARTGDDETLEKELALRQAEWTQVDVATMSLPDEPAAREAILLVTEDRLPLAEAARTAGSHIEEQTAFLEDLDPSLADRLLGAVPGETLGPIQTPAGYLIVQLTGKREPSLSEDIVRERARASVIERALERAVREEIVWHESA